MLRKIFICFLTFSIASISLPAIKAYAAEPAKAEAAKTEFAQPEAAKTKPEKTKAPDAKTAKAEAPNPDALFKQGKKYYNEKKYKLSFDLIKKAGELGYALAQYELGRLYSFGHGYLSEINDIEAFKWYLLAAENGYAPAQQLVAEMYFEGLGGVKKDQKEAAKWYKKAATQDYGNAEEKLNVLEATTISTNESLIKLKGRQAENLSGEIRKYNLNKECKNFTDTRHQSICQGENANLPDEYKNFIIKDAQLPCLSLKQDKIGTETYKSCEQFFGKEAVKPPSKRQKADWLLYILHGIIPAEKS